VTPADEAFVRQFRGQGNVLGDEPSRSLAQDADDRARRAQVSPLEDPRSRNAR
jgi:hypothetical protein